MRLAQVTKRVADLSEQYEVPEKLGRVSEKVYDGMSVAGQAARKGALAAYRTALDNPKASAIGGIILAAALVGGVLWYVFGNQRLASRKGNATHVREGTARRKRVRRARAAAA